MLPNDQLPERSDEESREYARYSGDKALANTYGAPLQEKIDTIGYKKALSGEQLAAIRNETFQFLHGAGQFPDTAQPIIGTIAGYAGQPADEQTQRGWANETRRALWSEYGPDEGARRLAVATAYVDAHPHLAEQVKSAGVAMNPKVILPLAHAATALRKPKK